MFKYELEACKNFPLVQRAFLRLSNTFGLFCLSTNWKPVKNSPSLCKVHVYGFQVSRDVQVVCASYIELWNFPFDVSRFHMRERPWISLAYPCAIYQFSKEIAIPYGTTLLLLYDKPHSKCTGLKPQVVVSYLASQHLSFLRTQMFQPSFP